MWKAPVRICSQSKVSLQNGRHIIRRNINSRKSNQISGNKFLTIAGTAVLATVGGSVALAKTSDGFRKFSEKNIPGSSFLYNLLLGPPVSHIPVFTPPVRSLEDGLLKKKLEREASKKTDDVVAVTPTDDLVESPKSSVDSTPLDVTEKPIDDEKTENPIKEDPVGLDNEVKLEENAEVVNDSGSDSSVTEETAAVNLSEMSSAEFETLLKELHAKASEAVKQAVDAQDIAAASIKKHVDLVFKSLEKIYEPGQTQENIWEPVFVATQDKNEAVHVAESRAHEARLAVAQLKEVVAHGLKNDQSIQTPDLITFDESVARALYSLETAKARVDAAQSEAKVMDEYRELVDTARHNLQMELSAIRPDLSPNLKTEGTKLGEEEVNILMAHAYWKIITLQKELAKQQSREQQRLKGALDMQRKEDFSILESRLRVELERQYYELKAKYNQDISFHEKTLSDQFTQQLKLQAAAYTDHLNDSLKTQYLELKRTFEAERELDIAKLAALHHEDLAKLHGMGKGIQDAIHDRAEKDRISRQVRELWIAAQSMMDSLRSNATVHLPWNEQRRPLNLNGLNQALNNNDEFASAVLESIPQSAVSQGILPQGALKERFQNVERVCRRVALIDENGGSVLRYALSYLQSMMVVKVDARPPPKQDEEINLAELNTFDILARARYHLEKDDLEQALRYMNLLKGEPQNVATDWLRELRIHLETVQAVNAVMTYAAVQAIESM
ncbi:MICOS complex subunit MIC60 isoform X2 [Daphnia magna]|uniref:MICOS complex subunit MIC60 isoform X2 n=1 Tax=Daphnia magna TaxID=35525 RepID=UPI001E1BCC02|nr:MICOS complex subunit MIC60 isoform X2 [Daphnia magna]